MYRPIGIMYTDRHAGKTGRLYAQSERRDGGTMSVSDRHDALSDRHHVQSDRHDICIR